MAEERIDPIEAYLDPRYVGRLHEAIGRAVTTFARLEDQVVMTLASLESWKGAHGHSIGPLAPKILKALGRSGDPLVREYETLLTEAEDLVVTRNGIVHGVWFEMPLDGGRHIALRTVRENNGARGVYMSISDLDAFSARVGELIDRLVNLNRQREARTDATKA